MKAKRNADGLRRNAQAKRREAFEKVEKGIQQLIKEKRPINFNQVAEVSGVSKAWLYKEPKVKSRIEHLREQSKHGKRLPRRISATEASTKALNSMLQQRIKKLESENRDLREQNEVAYGQVIQVRELKKKIEQLKAENEQLKSTGDKTVKGNQPTRPVTKDTLINEIEAVGVRMNSTIHGLVEKAPEGVIRAAIKALEERIQSGKVDNPGGFLNFAIRKAWTPNTILQTTEELTIFNQWWPVAYKRGLVIASEQVEGVIYIYTSKGERIPFSNVIHDCEV